MHEIPAAGEPAAPAGPRQGPPGARRWVCPGVPYRRRLLTGAGVALAAALFFWLALWQGASMQVSTVIGALFIGGFVWYLRVVAPTPYTLALGAGGIEREERGGAPAAIAWPDVAKVKEERFKNGRSISVTVYKRVGARGLHRAFVVYRDDVDGFDDLVTALRDGLPADRPWLVETVHE
jgi:hypothetical protein